MYNQFQKRLFAFIMVVFLVFFLFANMYSMSNPLLGGIFGRLLLIVLLVVIGVLLDRIKIEEERIDIQGLRAKCPFCNATYVYLAKSAIEIGTYCCQNCAKIFIMQSN